VIVDLLAFERSLKAAAPPADVSGAREALWHERPCRVAARPDRPALAGRSAAADRPWTRAHEIAQEIAGRDGSLDEEWRAIVEALLATV